jgi:uncharacterized membrane protein
MYVSIYVYIWTCTLGILIFTVNYTLYILVFVYNFHDLMYQDVLFGGTQSHDFLCMLVVFVSAS